MRIRIVIMSFGMVVAACGGGTGSTSSSAPTTSTSATTTTTAPATTVTTAAPTTTTTTLIEGPVDVLALVPFPLQMASFGPEGVGPRPDSGLTMALLRAPDATNAAPSARAVGPLGVGLVGVFGAAAGFPGDCLGVTLWAEDFSGRFVDGYIPLTEAGCGDVEGVVLGGDQVLLFTDRTLVVDLGTVPPLPFAPAFQVQNTPGDAGLYSVGQGVIIDPFGLATAVPGLFLPFGGDLFSIDGGVFTAISQPRPQPGVCEPGPNLLCLAGGRFQVEASFQRAAGGLGGGTVAAPGVSVPVGAIEINDPPDEGGFWFFDENNLELVVKVFNGCQINDRFWVFTSLLVDADAEVTITDTVSGDTLPLPQMPFEAVTDTQAFATCP